MHRKQKYISILILQWTLTSLLIPVIKFRKPEHTWKKAEQMTLQLVKATLNKQQPPVNPRLEGTSSNVWARIHTSKSSTDRKIQQHNLFIEF